MICSTVIPEILHIKSLVAFESGGWFRLHQAGLILARLFMPPEQRAYRMVCPGTSIDSGRSW
jgi:hypothetical protein